MVSTIVSGTVYRAPHLREHYVGSSIVSQSTLLSHPPCESTVQSTTQKSSPVQPHNGKVPQHGCSHGFQSAL